MREGTRGLFKGLFASVVGIMPFIGIKMASFDLLRHRYLPDKKHPRFDFINLSLGAVAGTIAVTFTYPTDVIRRLLQLSVSLRRKTAFSISETDIIDGMPLDA